MAETARDDDHDNDRHIDPGEMPYRPLGIPKSGFENYWYPIVTAREVRPEEPVPCGSSAATSCCSATVENCSRSTIAAHIAA